MHVAFKLHHVCNCLSLAMADSWFRKLLASTLAQNKHLTQLYNPKNCSVVLKVLFTGIKIYHFSASMYCRIKD